MSHEKDAFMKRVVEEYFKLLSNIEELEKLIEDGDDSNEVNNKLNKAKSNFRFIKRYLEKNSWPIPELPTLTLLFDLHDISQDDAAEILA